MILQLGGISIQCSSLQQAMGWTPDTTPWELMSVQDDGTAWTTVHTAHDFLNPEECAKRHLESLHKRKNNA